MKDERPTRIWVHPNFKQRISEFHSLLNKEVEEETGYPLPEGMPFATKMAAEIFDIIIRKIKKGKINILKLDEYKGYIVKINVSLKLKKQKGVKENKVEFR
jgi:hypothetical protein